MKSNESVNVPNSRRNLDIALQRKFGVGASLVQVRMAMANTIVGQLLPDVVIKGGTSLRLRYGRFGSRYTIDCDVARRCELDVFIRDMRMSLQKGWNGFSGDLVIKEPASPKGIPFEYVMQPFEIKLSYLGRSWCTVPLEVGGNEIGNADEIEVKEVASDIIEIFDALGFPRPMPVSLMSLTYQIAQKLHGLSASRSDRVRDLIDLQLILRNDEVDFLEVREICERLFRYRKCQKWPPQVVKGEHWEDLYESQRGMLPVLETVDEALVWVNSLINRISGA